MGCDMVEYLKDLLDGIVTGFEENLVFHFKDITYNDSDGLVMTCEYTRGDDVPMTNQMTEFYINFTVEKKLKVYGINYKPFHIMVKNITNE